MSLPSLYPEEEELKRCEEESQRLARELEAASELPKIILRAKLDSETTMPPIDCEIMRQIKEEMRRASHKSMTNTLKTQNRSILLLLMLVATAILLFAWGVRLMNG